MRALLNILFGFMIATTFFAVLTTLMGPAASSLYPVTTAKVQSMLGDFSGNIDNSTTSTQSASLLTEAKDVLGGIAAGMLGTFQIIFRFPEIMKSFIDETLVLFGLQTVVESTIYHSVSTIIQIGIGLYFAYSVIEWIRPGFTKAL